MIRLPETTRALVLRKSLVEKNPTYHDAVVEVQAIPTLKEGEILVKMAAVGFNRRDVSKESSVSLVHKLNESSVYFSSGSGWDSIRAYHLVRPSARTGQASNSNQYSAPNGANILEQVQ